MDCCEFREKYSDFADGLLDEADQLRARRHLSLCAPCRRFDAAFRTGVNALRDLPAVQVSRGFSNQLRGRLRHELVVRPLGVHPLSGTIAALLVLITIGLVSWDMAELRAARRAESVAAAPVPRPRPHARGPALDSVRPDSEQLFVVGFHPFDPALLVADSDPVLDANAARFDVPAVWGGR